MKSARIWRTLAIGALTLPAFFQTGKLSAQSVKQARLVQALAGSEEETQFQQIPVRYTRSKDFVLPFNLTEMEKSSVAEVQLHVRTPDSPWQKRASAGPSEGKFEFKVLEEGEIWFAVVTCDGNGLTNPADPRTMPPALRVLVDNTAPSFEMKAEPGKPPVNQPFLRLEAKDLHLEDSSLSVACFTGGTWHALSPTAGDGSLFPLPPAAGGTWKIRAICRDKAGNQGNFEGLFPPPEEKKAPPAPVAEKDGKPAPATTKSSDEKKAPEASSSPMQPGAVAAKPEPATAVASKASNAPSPEKAKPVEKKKEPDGPKKLVVNSTEVQLEYAVEEVGPSGVAKADVWLTRDNGLTWKILTEDTDGKSPADCKLPGEGEFGITLVLTNGSGAPGREPTPGEKPEVVLEVDTTFPTAKLSYAQVLATEGGGGPALFVKWEAKDKNLGEKPIRLLLGESTAGPFVPFAEPLANSGEFRWPVPANCPPKMYLKLEVMDAGGNLTQVEHPTPVLMDPARPKGKVLAARPGKAGGEIKPASNLQVPATLLPARLEEPPSNPLGKATEEPLAKPEPAPAPGSSLPSPDLPAAPSNPEPSPTIPPGPGPNLD